MAQINDGSVLHSLPKVQTGIKGLDEITNGGLPKGRTTLVCGNAGSGKTLLGIEFLVRGATEFGESGVLMSFEETSEDLIIDVASLGFDLPALIAAKKLLIDYVEFDRSAIEETGEYNLEGLFIRLSHAIDEVGAQRVVLDTIEALFSGIPNESLLRAELRRLFHWLKAKGVTSIVTGESGEKTLTRHGLEEYISDCVILLDNRVHNQLSTRRLHVVKYRGSTHGSNEYPFLIDAQGISVLPITSLGLQHMASNERISSGIPALDNMLGGQGYFRGSSVMISGYSGTGKSSIASCFADAACRRGEKVLYYSFEESASQIMRNMRSIGIDLKQHADKGLLRFDAERPNLFGLEMHLATIYQAIISFEPSAVILDPLSSLMAVGEEIEVIAMLTRLLDQIKTRHITAIFTNLSRGDATPEHNEVGISSLMDTWLLLRNLEANGERNRGLYILKSRGMAHSLQVREFSLTDHGVDLLDVAVGPDGVLTGSARLTQQSTDKEAQLSRQQEAQRHVADLEFKRQAMEAQVAVLRAEFNAQEVRVQTLTNTAQQNEVQGGKDRAAMSLKRQEDVTSGEE